MREIAALSMKKSYLMAKKVGSEVLLRWKHLKTCTLNWDMKEAYKVDKHCPNHPTIPI